MFPILYEVLIIEDSHLTTFYYLKQNKWWLHGSVKTSLLIMTACIPSPLPQTTNDFHFKSYNAQTLSTDYKERGIFSPPPDKRKLTNVVVKWTICLLISSNTEAFNLDFVYFLIRPTSLKHVPLVCIDTSTLTPLFSSISLVQCRANETTVDDLQEQGSTLCKH